MCVEKRLVYFSLVRRQKVLKLTKESELILGVFIVMYVLVIKPVTKSKCKIFLLNSVIYLFR